LGCRAAEYRGFPDEYFCDALGTIRDIIEPRGATIVGHWPTAGYHFEALIAALFDS
jgi:flavodoxin